MSYQGMGETRVHFLKLPGMKKTSCGVDKPYRSTDKWELVTCKRCLAKKFAYVAMGFVGANEDQK